MHTVCIYSYHSIHFVLAITEEGDPLDGAVGQNHLFDLLLDSIQVLWCSVTREGVVAFGGLGRGLARDGNLFPYIVEVVATRPLDHSIGKVIHDLLLTDARSCDGEGALSKYDWEYN
jgi:hypothetical protein